MANPQTVRKRQFSFDGLRLVSELKVNTTREAFEDKPILIRQAAAYGNTDIEIGFIVTLRGGVSV